jgi:hypothetical protein
MCLPARLRARDRVTHGPMCLLTAVEPCRYSIHLGEGSSSSRFAVGQASFLMPTERDLRLDSSGSAAATPRVPRAYVAGEG